MEIYSVVFLLNEDFSKIVLLRRAASKKFAPDRWTGIGGHMEGDEIFEVGALRELTEETGITSKDIRNFREVADITYQDGPYQPGGYRLIYYDGQYLKDQLPNCNEGTLHWVSIQDLEELDIIDDTKAVLKEFVHRVFGKAIDKPMRGEFIVGKTGVTDRVIFQ